MRRGLVVVLATVAALAAPGLARAAQCGLPDAGPLWVDFAGNTVDYRTQVFAKPAVVAAVQDGSQGAALRAGGAQTVYWEMNLPKQVGTSFAPADPSLVPAAANALFDRAVAASGCDAPLIALNELWSPTVAPPWTPQNSQYRTNVLTLLQTLASRGARPFLLVPSNPNTSGEAAAWWQQAAQSADIVREVYAPAPDIVSEGALLGSRTLRQKLRLAVQVLGEVGIPPAKVGLMLGFQSAGLYGRAGLQPLAAWLEFVKLDALAAKQVALDTGVGSVWSWGWGAFSPAGVDADKPTAACVYLWARDQSLCDAPALGVPEFDPDLQAGQIVLPDDVQCSLGTTGSIASGALDRVTALVGSRDTALTALLARAVQRARAPVAKSEVLAAERLLVRVRFRGSHALYRQALTDHGLTLDFARGIIADEVAREKLFAAVGPVAAWTEQAAQTALDEATCRLDELPAPGDVKLADWVDFLKLTTR